jgi:TRAP-type mannitol/chloroaromatic compound transport system permease large subunit
MTRRGSMSATRRSLRGNTSTSKPPRGSPDSIRTVDIYRGIAPFVGIQLIGLGLVALLPGLATWLPKVLLH